MSRPRVLLVDDELNLIRALQRSLRDEIDIQGCTDPLEALALLAKDSSFAVIVSDLSMPVMNGAEFLAKARAIAPNAVQIMLTGTLDYLSQVPDAAHIFRFLEKPVPNAAIAEAITDAMAVGT